jgi:hypothetical protein
MVVVKVIWLRIMFFGHCHGLAIPEELIYVIPGADGLVDLVEFIKCEVLKR